MYVIRVPLRCPEIVRSREIRRIVKVLSVQRLSLLLGGGPQGRHCIHCSGQVLRGEASYLSAYVHAHGGPSPVLLGGLFRIDELDVVRGHVRLLCAVVVGHVVCIFVAVDVRNGCVEPHTAAVVAAQNLFEIE